MAGSKRSMSASEPPAPKIAAPMPLTGSCTGTSPKLPDRSRV